MRYILFLLVAVLLSCEKAEEETNGTLSIQMHMSQTVALSIDWIQFELYTGTDSLIDKSTLPGTRISDKLSFELSPGTYKTNIKATKSNIVVAQGEEKNIEVIAGKLTKIDIELSVLNKPPVASFIVIPDSGLAGTNFTFDISNTHDENDPDSTLVLNWDFDGNGAWNQHNVVYGNATFTYSEVGTYYPILEVVDPLGYSSRDTDTVIVLAPNIPPIAHFSTDKDTILLGNTIQFDPSMSHDPDREYTTLFFYWDWQGDGITDLGPVSGSFQNYTYNQNGFFQPTLIVVDEDGASDTISKSIAVLNPNTKPTAVFTVSPAKAYINAKFTFDPTSSSDMEDASAQLTCRWDWTNDNSWDTGWLELAPIQYSYSTPGVKTIKLQVKDSQGLTDEITHTVEVEDRPQPPIASFTVSPKTANINTIINFNAVNSHDPDGADADLLFRWDYDNNGEWDTYFENKPFSSKSYVQWGTKVIRLEVKDAQSLTDTTIDSVLIIDTSKVPTAVLKVTPSWGTLDSVFKCDPTESTSPIFTKDSLLARWDFNGDGSWDTGYQPLYEVTHQFTSANTYNIIMEIKDPWGLFARDTFKVEVSTIQAYLKHDLNMSSTEYINTVDISDNGFYVASGGSKKQVYVWESVNGNLTNNFGEFQGAITACKFNNANTHLAIGLRSSSVVIQSFINATKKILIGHRNAVTDVAFSNTDSRLLSVDESGKLFVWIWEEAVLEKQIPITAKPIYQIQWDDRNNRIVIATDGAIQLLYRNTWESFKTLYTPLNVPLTGLSIDPTNGDILAVGYGILAKINGSNLSQENFTNEEFAVATDIIPFKIEGTRFWAIGRTDGYVMILNEAGSFLYKWMASDANQSNNRRKISSLAATEESNILVTGCYDGHVKIWEIR